MVDSWSAHRIARAGALVLLAATACVSSGNVAPPPTLAPEPEAITERDIANDPTLYDDPGETLFLSLESAHGKADPGARDTGGAGQDEVPFLLEDAQTLELCADTGGENDSFQILGDSGSVLGASSGQCNTATLDAGRYRFQATRDPGVGDAPPLPVFVHSQNDDAQCPTNIDPFAQTGSRWLLTTPWGWQSWSDTGIGVGVPKAGDPGTFDPAFGTVLSRTADGSMVYESTPDGKPGVSFLPVLPPMPGAPGGFFFLGSIGSTSYAPTPLALVPQPGTTWSFFQRAVVGGQTYPFLASPEANGAIFVGLPAGFTPPSPPLDYAVTLAMRAYPTPPSPDPTNPIDTTPLGIGEVAFTPLPTNGYTYVINDANAFPADFTKVAGMTFSGNFKGVPFTLAYFAIRTGCDASVTLYSAPNMGGQSRFIGQNTRLVPLQDMMTLSARVLRTKKVLVETNKCTGCNLAGVNLSGYSMAGVQLANVDMSRANLAGTVMDGAKLSAVRLDRANLSGTSLLGATFTDVAFTATDLRQTKLDPTPAFTATLPADPCATGPGGSGMSRFAGTSVKVGQLPPTIWKYLDLSNAKLDATGVPPSALSVKGLSLCGSRLSGVSLASFDVSQAQLDRSDLTNASLQSITGTGASFYFAKLGGADLGKASLINATLDNVSGSKLKLGYASFNGGSMTDATLPGIQAPFATFTSMDMSRTSFEGDTSATFYGSSFQSVKLDAAKLSNVLLNYTTLVGTSLTGAKLVQAQFSNATFQGSSLASADANSAIMTEASLFDVDMTKTKFFLASSGSTSASFERATVCGGTFSETDLSSATLTAAYFPSTTGPITLASGQTSTCLAVNFGGLTTTAATICPSGNGPSNGTSCAGSDWVAVSSPPPPCCDPTQGQTCKFLKSGQPCKVDCDCRSKRCLPAGLCQ